MRDYNVRLRCELLRLLVGIDGRRALAVITTTLPKVRYRQLDAAMLQALRRLADKRALPALVLALDADAFIRDEQLYHNRYAQLAVELSGRPMRQLLRETAAEGKDLKLRCAAVDLLVRAEGKDAALHLLADLPQRDAFTQTLRFWMQKGRYIPTTMQRYAMAAAQLQPEYRRQLTRALAAYELLRKKQPFDYDPADTYLLAHLQPEQLAVPLATIRAEIRRRLAVLGHTYRSQQLPAGGYSERFEDAQQKLRPPQLLLLELLLEQLQTASMRRQIAAAIAADLADERSEVGGACFIRDGQVVLRRYEPMLRALNNRYVASDDLIADSFMCLCRFHCHARSSDDSAFAGPGSGDIKHAARFGGHYLVLTNLGRGRFNVDYHDDRGIVVDLGNYGFSGLKMRKEK